MLDITSQVSQKISNDRASVALKQNGLAPLPGSIIANPVPQQAPVPKGPVRQQPPTNLRLNM